MRGSEKERKTKKGRKKEDKKERDKERQKEDKSGVRNSDYGTGLGFKFAISLQNGWCQISESVCKHFRTNAKKKRMERRTFWILNYS